VTYVADVIVLDRRPVIRIRSVAAGGTFLFGYFASVQAINIAATVARVIGEGPQQATLP
jgi:hypothetical protein